jgi:ubiquinone/menaquinone biosynthesis C-methylase UbiE
MRKVDAATRAGEPSEVEVIPTQAGYDRWSEFYDQDDNPLVLLEEEHIGGLIGEVAGLKVADIGCGTGRHAVRLAAAGAKVTAVDFSEGMLEKARTKPGTERVNFVQHDLAQPLPLPRAAFDRVLCCLVLDHVADLKTFFAELKRLCRPSGAVVISVIHPAMTLRGVQARFIDPGSGRRIGPLSYVHQTSDYLMAAVRAGLELVHMSEYAPGPALAARSPRAVKYVGWPVLLLMRFALKRGKTPSTKPQTPGKLQARKIKGSGGRRRPGRKGSRRR